VIFPAEIEAKLSGPDTQNGRLQRMILARLHEHEETDGLPTSVRFIWYELKDQLPERPKSHRRLWSQDISAALMDLREDKLVPWSWIEDETKRLQTWAYSPSVYSYAIEAVEDARIDCWGGARPPVIITESRSLSGVLKRIAAEYLCPIIGTGGQAGGVLHTDVIPELRRNQRVLYFGDLNEAGSDIEANTRRVSEEETGPLQWERLLLTPEQVRRYLLPSKETTDNRYTKEGGRTSLSWEAEALGQSRIQRMLRDRLDALLPEPLERVRVLEERQRRDVARLLRRK
jgi:hypothetical protein